LGSAMSLDLPVHLQTVRSANVIGILPGTDPALRRDAVLYTAHHDHLGRVQPVPPATDGIFNGALDNASGCATVLAIARAATFAPPKRSIMVAFKGGPAYVGRPKGWGEEQMLDYERHHYHQPSDEYHGDWDLSGDVQDAQLQLLVGLRLANAPALPTWTPGDEFEAARKSASR